MSDREEVQQARTVSSPSRLLFPGSGRLHQNGRGKNGLGSGGDFCDVIEARLQSDSTGIRESFPAIVRFADYVMTHFGDYGYEPEDEDLRQRLAGMKLQCAGTGTGPKDVPRTDAGPNDRT